MVFYSAPLFFLFFRKDLKFVTEVEEEIKNLVELANKVRGEGDDSSDDLLCALWWPSREPTARSCSSSLTTVTSVLHILIPTA